MADQLAQYDALIKAAADKHGVPVEHLRAIMQQEDPTGDPQALGYDKHGHGLMQIDDRYHDTAKADDPAWNINEGARIYAEGRNYLRKGGVPEDKLDEAGLAAYNHGPEKTLANYKAGRALGTGTTPDAQGRSYDQSVLAKLTGSAKGQTGGGGGDQVYNLEDGSVPMRNENGDYYRVPENEARGAIHNEGLKPVTAAEFNEAKYQRAQKWKYSGVENLPGAVAGGALNMGLADAGDAAQVEASRALGGDKSAEETKERIRGEREYQKGGRFVGGAAFLAAQHFAGVGEAKDAAMVAKALESAGEAGKVAEAAAPAFRGVEEAKGARFTAGPEGIKDATPGVGRAGFVENNPTPFEPELAPKPPVPGSDEAWQSFDAAHKGALGTSVPEAFAEVKAKSSAGYPKQDWKDLLKKEGIDNEGVDHPEVGQALLDQLPPERTAAGRVRGGRPSVAAAPEEVPAFRNVVAEPPPTGKYNVPRPAAVATELPPDEVTSEMPRSALDEPVAPSATADAPVTPLAPPYARQAFQFATKPSRALFGMGEKFGSAVENAVGGGLNGKIAGRFAEGALTSVPYTIGGQVSDSEVDNTPLSGEHLAAGLSINALIGGGFGGLLGAAEHGLHKIKLSLPEGASTSPLSKLQIIKNATGSLQSIEDHVNAASSAAFTPDANGVIPKYARMAQILGGSTRVVEMQPKPLADAFGRATDLSAKLMGAGGGAARVYGEGYSAFQDALKAAKTDAEVMAALDQFKMATDKAINWDKVPFQALDPQKSVKDAIIGVRGTVKDVLENEEVFGKAAAFQKEFNEKYKVVADLAKKADGMKPRFKSPGVLAGEPRQVYDAVKVGKFINGVNDDKPLARLHAERSEAVLGEWLNAQRDLVGFLKKEIHEPLGNPHNLENLHDSLGANDAKYAQSMKDAKILNDQVTKTPFQRFVNDRGTRLGVAAGLMAAGVNHAFLITYGVGYALEQALGAGMGRSGVAGAIADHGLRFGKVIAEQMEAAFRNAGKYAGAVGALKHLTYSSDAEPPKARPEQVAHATEHLIAAVTDPGKVAAKVQASTHLLAVAHPELAQAVQVATLRAVQYLHDQAPKDPLPPSPFPTMVKYRPGHGEVARFETIAEVTHNPLVLIRDFGNGSLTTEQVHAATSVYPELTAQIQAAAMNALAEHATPLPYQKKLAFMRLTGVNGDWAVDSVAKLQKVFPPPPVPDPSAGGAANKPRKAPSQKAAGALAQQTANPVQSSIQAV